MNIYSLSLYLSIYIKPPCSRLGVQFGVLYGQ